MYEFVGVGMHAFVCCGLAMTMHIRMCVSIYVSGNTNVCLSIYTRQTRGKPNEQSKPIAGRGGVVGLVKRTVKKRESVTENMGKKTQAERHRRQPEKGVEHNSWKGQPKLISFKTAIDTYWEQYR